MAKFNTGQSFADGDTVTGAKLNNITSQLNIYTGVISEQTAMAATVSTADQLLIADVDNGDSGAANRVTVQKLFSDSLTNGTFASVNLTGTITSNRTVATSATITTGTIPNLTSSTANITLGTIPTLTAGTTTSTAANITNGTVQTLTASTATITGGTYSGAINSTTGTIGTLNSTTGTIATLNSTTGTIATLNSTTGTIPTLVATTLITTGTGTDVAPAIVPTGDTNTGIFFPTADTIAFSRGGVESMRINSLGFVGIGINAGRQLEVSGGTATIGVTSTAAGGNTVAIDPATTANGGLAQIDCSGANALRFNTNSTEAMRIDSSGNVGIGTTSPAASLHSVSTSAIASAGIFQVTATSATSQSAVAIIKQDALNTTNQNFVLFLVGATTTCGKINANGANAAAFGSTSDSRLKENITALPSQIDNIFALKPCEFDYKDGSGHQIGFIAQEMQQIYPDSVGVGDDGMLTITAWSKTEARLVKAIQELKAKNDSLEARLQALEG